MEEKKTKKRTSRYHLHYSSYSTVGEHYLPNSPHGGIFVFMNHLTNPFSTTDVKECWKFWESLRAQCWAEWEAGVDSPGNKVNVISVLSVHTC